MIRENLADLKLFMQKDFYYNVISSENLNKTYG